MNLPTREEINPYDDLDGRVACKNLLGRSVEQAEALLRENSLGYQEDYMWMGPVAFRYYLPAVVNFVHSEAADDSEIVAHFAGTLGFRLEYEPQELAPVAEQLVNFCDYVVQNWSRFSFGNEGYGDIRARYASLCQAFSRLAEKCQN